MIAVPSTIGRPNLAWRAGVNGVRGGGKAVVSTDPPGATWVAQTSGTGVYLYGTSFATDQVGWAVGGGGKRRL